MRRAILCSGTLHVVVATLAYFHLWDLLFPPPPLAPTTIAVSMVNVAPETHATKPNPKPKSTSKPAEETVEAVEPPKPPPPKPAPPPPPSPPPAPMVAQAPEPPKPEPPKPEAPKPPPSVPPPPAPAEPPLQAQAPKPEAPKPPPPPPPKPTPPKPVEKKVADRSLDDFLKNLARRPEAPKSDEHAAKTPPPQQVARANPQPDAPLGAQLTTSELDVIKQQLHPCWNPDPGAANAAQLRPEFRVWMNADGTVRTASLVNADQLTDPAFRAAAEAAGRALRNPACQPLKFPPEKYSQWQVFTVTFSPKDFE